MTPEYDEPIVTTATRPREREGQNTRRIPPHNVILYNDDHHSFEFVIETLQKALSLGEQKAILLTSEAHNSGRAIVWSGSKEVAEFKIERIRTFHEVRDDGRNLGPLGCDIEPAA